MNKFFAFTFLILGAIECIAQEASDTSGVLSKIYTLGEVQVSASLDKASIDAAEIQKYNANDVSSALRTMPSLIISENGSRNESTVYLRGFDIRSVPVYMDGIPVYVPYDGYVDLARFTTNDLARIDVSKGFSSMTYGANTIGGAINLIGMKPTQKLELSAKVGVRSGQGYETKINLGSNLGKIYFQTGFSILQQEFVPLSAKFDTLKLETDHQRDNSYRKDMKGSLKIGFTPNATDEYSINYQYSHGSKGNPVYLGNDKNTRVRYWQWPYWDKQSIYYISKTAIGKKSDLKARAYLDQFKNKISSFDNNTYSTQNKGSSFNSYYDDYTVGGNLEFGSKWNEENHLRASLHAKNDNHSEHNEGEPVRHFADNTFSLGIENIYKPGSKLSFIPGLSYNIRKSLRAEDYNSTDSTIINYPANKNDALNAQLATYYKISNAVNVSFNISYKSRFATMKDRYSYRNGTALPNPDLKSETAVNLELSSSVELADKVNFHPELFYSRLNNTIQMVSNVQGDLSQMLNTGESVFKGVDLSLVYQPVSVLNLYAAYSYIQRKNISNPDILFTDVPNNKLFASADYTIAKKLGITISGEFNSERNNASDGTRVSPGYFIMNGQASYHFAKYITAELGVNNIFDKNYTIQEGYPEAGRNFYAAIYFNLQRKNE
ncbi:MAG: TonB-dependent receptor [Bacteroidales bacterium]|nr:TonB-dependent receptor [Bacteroidales bacterium]